jgi:hypothetical protein
LQGRRTEVQAKTAASRIALGLRQQNNIKLWKFIDLEGDDEQER